MGALAHGVQRRSTLESTGGALRPPVAARTSVGGPIGVQRHSPLPRAPLLLSAPSPRGAIWCP
eukprot:7551551-Alexandrium_andersonii.AAC.1